MRVLAVITYAGADDLCRARLSNWVNMTNPDEVLFSGANKPFWYPNGAKVMRVGEDRYCDTAPGSLDRNLPLRLTETMKVAMTLTKEPMSLELCIIEPDVWFWRSPWPAREGFTGRRFLDSGNRSFWHWPYIIRGTGQVHNLATTCGTLLKYGASCNPWGSFPDRFIGLAVELAQTPYSNGAQASFNTIETEAQIQECLEYKRNGAYAVHGVKDQQTLERLA